MLRGNGVSRAALITGLAVTLCAGLAAAKPTGAAVAARHLAGPARVTSALMRAAPAARAVAARPAAAEPAICKSAAHPALAARISRGIRAAMSKRSSIAGVTADDRITGVTCAFQPDRHFYSASVVKATILAALLRKLLVRHQYLSRSQAALAT